MSYRRDLWEVAATNHGVVTVASAEDAGVPAVEVRKLAARGALRGYGLGVYVHGDIPPSPFTQPAVAVALGGEDAFLHREAVLDLLGLGQFNPNKIRVGTTRRVRRTLPEWMALERRNDITEDDITWHEGIRATTVQRSLRDIADRMPQDRWLKLVDEAVHRGLLESDEALRLTVDAA